MPESWLPPRRRDGSPAGLLWRSAVQGTGEEWRAPLPLVIKAVANDFGQFDGRIRFRKKVELGVAAEMVVEQLEAVAGGVNDLEILFVGAKALCQFNP